MALIEFNNLPDTSTPINAEILNNNFNELNKSNTYSTEEKVVGTWIDGTPLYRKVITYNGSSLGEKGTEKRYTMPHGISNLNTIKSIKYSANSTSGSSIYVLPYINEDTQGLIKTSIDLYDKQNLTLAVLNDTWVNLSLEIVLEYTKTTD